MSRYEVVNTGRVIGPDTEVFTVSRNGVVESNVWRTPDGICRCTQCSGPLTAMSASCAHARAVKRSAGVALLDGECLSHQVMPNSGNAND